MELGWTEANQLLNGDSGRRNPSQLQKEQQNCSVRHSKWDSCKKSCPSDVGKPYKVVGPLKDIYWRAIGTPWGSYGAEPHLGAAFTQHTAGGGTAAGHGLWAAMGLFWAALGWLWSCYGTAMGNSHSSVGLTYPHTELAVNLLPSWNLCHIPPLPF